MTHQPPVPQAAQSPFPLQPAAHNDGAAKVASPSPARPAAELPLGLAQLLGLGAALVGSAALATWYYRRKPAPQPAVKARATPNKRRAASPDAARVAGKQPYEVSYFARKHGITVKQARDIIAAAGPSRTKANALAKERSKA